MGLRTTLAIAGCGVLLAANLASAQPLRERPGILGSSSAPNSALLIAKAKLVDPNFRRTVVLVTQAEDASTVGVILNRPSTLSLPSILPEDPNAARYTGTVYLGGPVMRRILVAIFVSEVPPPAPAFALLPNVYLSIHPQNIDRLLKGDDTRYRLYVGFSGWAPRQLENELGRDDWFVQPADEDSLFSSEPGQLWRKLHDRAASPRAGIAPGELRDGPGDPENPFANEKPRWRGA